MALENARAFLEQVMKDKALRARTAEKEPAEVVAIARELGLEATAEELEQAVKAMRQEAGEPKELTPDELDKAAGGTWWTGEDAPDGHEMGCAISWHHYMYQKENNIWCNLAYYCNGEHQQAPNWMDV